MNYLPEVMAISSEASKCRIPAWKQSIDINVSILKLEVVKHLEKKGN